MKMENFTIKAQEAVQKALQSVSQNGQQIIETEHLLKGVLDAGESVSDFLLKKTGARELYRQVRVCLKECDNLVKLVG